MLRNAAAFLLLAVLAAVLPAGAGHAGEVRMAAWNLEHLNDTDRGGCVARTRADYDALARQVAALDADVVAFQEVENEAAARRVFPAQEWHVAVSSRPTTGRGRACRDRPHARLGHLATRGSPSAGASPGGETETLQRSEKATRSSAGGRISL